jgi:predicted DsbA family dithiol-disulfide isomerase
MNDYIQQFAAKFGVFDMVRTTRMPNTRRALAIAEFARDRGKLDDFRKLTLAAHWQEGRDIEDDKVLHDIAIASSLPPDDALSTATDPVYLDRIAAVRSEFKSLDIGGIPAFVFDNEIIEGCQTYAVIVEAALRAGVRPRITSP